RSRCQPKERRPLPGSPCPNRAGAAPGHRLHGPSGAKGVLGPQFDKPSFPIDNGKVELPAMTARIDLTELAQRENEQTEWKENVADIDDVVATLSAFANDFQNLGGGYVVCGAKEEQDAEGFPRLVRIGLTAGRLREVENTVLARCRDRVSPPLVPLVEELPTDDASRRVLVFLQPATGTAHTFRRGQE